MPKTISILNSWFTDVQRGSGTARAIANTTSLFQALGYTVQLPNLPCDQPDAYDRRVCYNLELERQPELVTGDIVIGCDADGYRWAQSSQRQGRPYLALIKGVLADEAQFEQGEVRQSLLTQARWEKENCQVADLVITTSQYSKSRLHELYQLADEKIIVLPEFINVADWQRRLSAVPKDQSSRLRILTVGYLYPRKNIGMLIEAVHEMAPDYLVELWVVGDGPERKRWEEVAVQLRVADRVRFYGAISDSDLYRLYALADIFCLPSLQEGFGIVLLEAMASGLPIVAINRGAIPEVINANCALLVEPAIDELYGALIQLVDDAARRHQLGTAGRKVVQRFDRAAAISRYQQLLNRLA